MWCSLWIFKWLLGGCWLACAAIRFGYAEIRYARFGYAEIRYARFGYAEIRYARFGCAETHYVRFGCAETHYVRFQAAYGAVSSAILMAFKVRLYFLPPTL